MSRLSQVADACRLGCGSAAQNLPSNIQHPISNIQHPISATLAHTANERGYALYLVLLVLTVAAILFSVTLTRTSQVNVQSIRVLQKLQAQLLAESGVERLEDFFNGGDGHDISWETDGLDETFEGYGSIHLACKRFGAYSRFVSTGKRLTVERTVSGLAGRDVPEALEPVLTLTGSIGGLVLAEGSTMDGDVVLHHGAVKRDNNRNVIRGYGEWTRHEAAPALPLDTKPLDDFMAECRELLSAAPRDSAAIGGNLVLNHENDTLLNRHPLVVLGDCEVQKVNRSEGLVVATGTVRITNNTKCRGIAFVCNQLDIAGGTTEHCAFFSPASVHIESGNHGSQFFSTDSLVVATSARLRSPGLLVSRRRPRPDSTLSGGVTIAEGVQLRGTVISYSDSTKVSATRSQGMAVQIGKGTDIEGCVITDGDLDIQDVSIRGSVYARTISTVRNKLPAKNWLFGCRLRAPDAGSVFPLLGEKPVQVRLAVGR